MTVDVLLFEPEDDVGGGEQLGQVVPLLAGLVGQVTAADLRLSTPCRGWETRDLLNHVVGGARMYAGALQGGPVRAISGRQPDVVGDDPAGALALAAEEFGAAAGSPGAMDVVLLLPFGAMTGRTFLRFASFDLLVHSWDLGRTLDLDVDVPDAVVEPIERFAGQVLATVARDGVDFGPAVDPPPGATALERLVALTGRRVEPR